MLAAGTALAVLAVLLSGCGGGHSSSSSSNSSTGGGSSGGGGGSVVYGTNVLTYHNDVMRSGQDLSETVLTPQNVNATSFGKLRTLATDGAVDAAPLIVSGLTINGSMRNVLYVATENDSVYAYDADSGTLLQHVSLLGSGEKPSDPRSCTQVSPQIGITSTPVIDPFAGPSGTLFVVAMSKDGAGTYYQRLHALDLLTLADRMASQTITASAPANGPNSSGGVLQFNPAQYKERSALTLQNGHIYLAFASHCDINPYNGWILSYDESTLAQSSVLAVTPNGTEGAIWDTGGMTADSSGNLYATIANGSFDTTLNAQGMPSQQDFGNAALKIATNGAALTVTDYFTPSNTATESANDVDFGSGSMLLLVDQTDASGAQHQLLIGGGKDGSLYVLDSSNMGRFNAAGDQVYERIGVGGSLFSAPAYFNGSVYVCDEGDTLKAYTFSNAMLPPSPTSQTSMTFAYPGTSPAISAQGTANGIVWALESAQGSPAVLYAFNPANLGQQYYDSTQAAAGRDSFGNGNKFITPVIANGKVFVGTPNGVAVFGLL
jgi:hypothetical protein